MNVVDANRIGRPARNESLQWRFARLTAELGENGFAVQEVYSNVAGDPYEPDSPVLAVVAQLV